MTREETILRGALDEFDLLLRHRQRGGLEDMSTMDAVCWRLAMGVNRLAQLPPERRDSLVGAGWSELWTIRNHITHDYRSIPTPTVESILEKQLSGLLEALRREPAA
jgi:uncharacterized protein with HEPN domain